jgi:hypothetical protein
LPKGSAVRFHRWDERRSTATVQQILGLKDLIPIRVYPRNPWLLFAFDLRAHPLSLRLIQLPRQLNR